MHDPSAWSVIGGFAAFFAIVFLLTCAWLATVRRFQTPASARPAAQLPRVGVGSTVPYHCATYGHYFVRRYSDRWRCAKCGVLSDIVPSDLGDGAA